jgi:hypothetical protein
VVGEGWVIVGDDKGSDVDVGRLEFLRKRVKEVGRGRNVVSILGSGDLGVGTVRSSGDTIISDQWIGKNQDLTRVRGVGQGFGVSDHTCSVSHET